MSDRQRSGTGVSTVYLHVGTMKTGTTYLQGRLKEHRRELAREGVLSPARQLTALRDWFGRRGTLGNPKVAGSWDRMVGALRTSDASVGVVSMEYLSTCTPQEVQEVVREFAPAEVHIVLTVRDLPRVMAAQWQETLQNRAVWTWQEYSDDIVEHLADDESLIASAGTSVAGAAATLTAQELADDETLADGDDGDGVDAELGDELDDALDAAEAAEAADPSEALKTVRRTAAGRFWRQHDVVRIVRDWTAAAGADRVHIVTVPPSGSPPDVLWERFCAVIGVDPDRYVRRKEVVHANTGLDLAAAEFLRRLNERLEPDISRPAYLRHVKHLLGKAALVGREPALKPMLTPDQHDRVVRHSERLVAHLQERRLDIVGDLGDLIPTPLGAAATAGHDGLEQKVTNAALDAVVAMIRQLEERAGSEDAPAGRRERPAERQGGERQGGARQGGERQGGERQGGERQGGARQGGERQGGERQGGERPGGERQGARRRARREEELKAAAGSGDGR